MDAGPRQLCSGQLTGRPWGKVRVGEGVNEQEAPSVPAAFGALSSTSGVCHQTLRPSEPSLRSSDEV